MNPDSWQNHPLVQNILTTLTPVDIAVIVLILASMALGFKRGLSGEISRLISTVSAFCVGWAFYRPVGAWFQANTRFTESQAYAAAFFVMVFAVVATMLLLRFTLGKVMKVVFDPSVDRGGGCLAGFIRAALLAIIFFVLMNLWPHDYLNRVFGSESFFGRLVVRFMPAIQAKVAEVTDDPAAATGGLIDLDEPLLPGADTPITEAVSEEPPTSEAEELPPTEIDPDQPATEDVL